MVTARTTIRRVRGVDLFERRVGQGPEVVMLHGGPGAHHDYLLPGCDLLARGRTLVYYDQRGGGRSPVPREVPVGWQEHVADLESLRDLWGAERLSLLGYSWGGLLGLLYLLRHPERVAHLALVAPAPCWREARGRFETRFAERNSSPELTARRAALRTSDLKATDPGAYRRRAFELSVAGYFHDPDRAAAMTPFRVTGRTQEEVWKSLGDYDLREALGGVHVDALVVQGASDPIPMAVSRELAMRLQAPLKEIPACGHAPFVEAPEAFRSILDGFLPRHADGVNG